MNIDIMCIVMSQSYVHGYGYGYSYGYMHVHGLSYNQKQVILGLAHFLILYRLLDTYPPIYHENYPIIKPILLPDITMVSMPGLSSMSIDMGICMGAWLCAWLRT